MVPGDKMGVTEQERGEPHITPITSRFSPLENLALKALVSQHTSSHFPPKPQQAHHGFIMGKPTPRCFPLYLPTCFPKGQGGFTGQSSPWDYPGWKEGVLEHPQGFLPANNSLKHLPLLHAVFISSISKHTRV